MEEKDTLIGGSGVDTQYERDQINYRPTITPPEKISSGGALIGSGSTDEFTLEPDTSVPYPATDIYVTISDTYNYVTNLVDSLKEELKDSYIPVAKEKVDAILSSPILIDGIETITVEQGIPFDIYDEAILHPENPTYEAIQDAVEEFAEDVDGNIMLELYPDAKELQLNLEEVHYLMGGTVYNRLVDGSEVPDTPAMNDEFYQKMKDAEGKQQEAYKALQGLHKINESIYYEQLTSAYESTDYFEALEDFEGTKKELDDFSRKINQQTDFISFAHTDTSMTSRCARRINRYVVQDSSVDQTEVETLLSKQYEDKADLAHAYAQMQAATKLQINKQIEVKKQNKDILKTTGGAALKKRVHDEVMTVTNIRNDVFLDLYGMMNNMVDPTRSEGVETFLNQVAEGMELVRENYKSYLQEMYQAHILDQEVRFNKVNLAGDKQIARDGYWLLDNLLK